jgi:cytochrome c oxidase accessory protein FixG
LKSKNIFELDPERLATTDEYGNRIFIYPEEVRGIWKERRKFFYWFLIIVYLVLPWIYIEGKPSLMVNIVKREFTFLGQTLYGVEPILFFLLVASGLFLIGFMTSLYGRVWCGWACPQTVFIQSIFMKIEAFFEGSARTRRELEKSPWTLSKILRKSLKWGSFSVISLHIAHTFVGYFVGPRELFMITMQSPLENWGVFSSVMILTTIFLLDFGWFREQFCIIACPYGRMQSVLMDENSLIVSYDTQRGEPRRGSAATISSNEGDCINCYQCVKVCPTGIDIRRGTQLECIACTQCIDACDNIMIKLKKPKGLIRYSSENEILGKKRKMITMRSVIYLLISFILISLFFYFLKASTNLNMVFLRSKVPFQNIENGKFIINHFTLKLSHQGSKKFKVDFKLVDPKLNSKIQVITNAHPTVIDGHEKKIVLFFKFLPSLLSQEGTLNIKVQAIDADRNLIMASQEVTLVGPSH